MDSLREVAPERPVTLEAMENLAGLLRCLGRLEEAESLYQVRLEHGKGTPEKPDRAAAYRRLLPPEDEESGKHR